MSRNACFYASCAAFATTLADDLLQRPSRQSRVKMSRATHFVGTADLPQESGQKLPFGPDKIIVFQQPARQAAGRGSCQH
jgi:hypothetical protein